MEEVYATVAEVAFDDLLTGAHVSSHGGRGTAVERSAHIVQQAEAEAAAVRARAEGEGYEAGFASGLAAARAEAAPTLETLEAIVREAAGARDALAEALELRIAELAVLVAEKVLGATVEARPEAVLDVVGAALRRVAARDHLVVEVNPADLDLVREHVEGMTGRLGGFHRVEVVAERRVGRGGCILRTQEGEVDASFEEQLARAQVVLLEALRAEHVVRLEPGE
ncbi:MAG: FliH/SctL family protein [Thermoleophilia bacterium]